MAELVVTLANGSIDRFTDRETLATDETPFTETRSIYGYEVTSNEALKIMCANWERERFQVDTRWDYSDTVKTMRAALPRRNWREGPEDTDTTSLTLANGEPYWLTEYAEFYGGDKPEQVTTETTVEDDYEWELTTTEEVGYYRPEQWKTVKKI